jgi:hypothetical protein
MTVITIVTMAGYMNILQQHHTRELIINQLTYYCRVLVFEESRVLAIFSSQYHQHLMTIHKQSTTNTSNDTAIIALKSNTCIRLMGRY